MSETSSVLSEIGKWTEANRDVGHDEIVAKFANWIGKRLGYSIDDRTLRLNEAKLKGKPDIQGKDLNEKTVLVIEVKTESDHIEKSVNRKRVERDQLKRYLTDNTIDPAYLMLTDGVLLFFYENRNRTLMLSKELSVRKLSRITSSVEKGLIELCSQPKIDYTIKARLDVYISFLKAHPQHLDSKEGIDFFVRKFALQPDGRFGELVANCLALMDHLDGKSKFFQGAYEFWNKTFFHEADTLPKTWKAFFKSLSFDFSTKEKRRSIVQRFEFALETAYNIFSRLIIAKAMEDLTFHEAINEDPPLEVFRKNLKFLRGITNPIYYGLALVRLTEVMREGFVRSVFEMDIFDWWVDAFRNEDSGIDLEKYDFAEIEKISDARLGFSKAIMQLLGQLYVFDFSHLGEDLFGLLYQAYFDKDTRKALGEFYTPREITRFILDKCGYVPNARNRIMNRRLIDPACGSGTFLVEAIKRFLEDARSAGITAQEALDKLCNRVHIVGLDIHPFAAQLAKLNFVLHLLPTYSRAIKEDRNFVLKRIPIFRTDSLFNETSATEKGRLGQTSLGFNSVARELEFGIPLPIKGEDGKFINLILELPDRGTVQRKLKLDEEEYFDVLQGLFASIRKVAEDQEIDKQLHTKIESFRDSQALLMALGKLYRKRKRPKKFDNLRDTVKRKFGQDVFDQNKDLLKTHYNNLSVFKEYSYPDIVYHSIVRYISKLDIPSVVEKIKSQLDNSLRQQGFEDMDFDRVVEFFYPYCSRILLDAKYLKYRFGDGRLISSIEDRILSILLKHYFRYDIVVANPPYVRIQRIAKYDPKLREHYDTIFSEVVAGNYDLYIPFIAQGIDLLLDKGLLGYICSNRFTTVNYGQRIREFIPGKSIVHLFLDFRDTGVFKDALNYPAIFVLEKDARAQKDRSCIVCCRMRMRPKDVSDEEILEQIRERWNLIRSPTDHIETEAFDMFGFDPTRLTKDGWYFMPYREQLVFDHIKQAGKALSEYTESSKSGSALFEGSSTGSKSIFVVEKILKKNGRVLVFSPAHQENFQIEEDIVKPYVEDARRWISPYFRHLLIFPYKSNADRVYKLIPPDVMRKQYPLAWKYLSSHKEMLRSRVGFKDRSDWYAYSAPRSLEDYEEEKFLIQGFTRSSAVSLDIDSRLFFGPDIYGLRLRKLSVDEAKIMLAIMNSKLADFYVKHVGVIHGSGYYKYEDRFVKELPIKMPEGELKDNIVGMVTQICRLSKKTFPEDFGGNIDSYKIGSRAGEFDISLKKDKVLIPYSKKGLMIRGLQMDLDESVIVKLDHNGFVKCPSRAHWYFIEQYILSHAKKRADKVQITKSFVSNIFIPKDANNMQLAVSSLLENQKRIAALEEDLDKAIYRLYGVEDVQHAKHDGIAVIEHFLAR